MVILPLPLYLYLLLTATVLLGGGFDLSYRRIPNWITLPGLFLGVVLNAVRGRSAGILFALLGMGAALLIYVPLYLLRGMGAGDVKLMGAVGAIVGPANWVVVFLASALIGGLAAAVLILRHQRWHTTMGNVSLLLGDLVHLRAPYRNHSVLDVRDPHALRLPHGVSIAGGAMLLVVFALLGSP